MNLRAITLILGLGAVSLAFKPAAEIKTINIKPDASKIEWYAEKVTGTHNGYVRLKEGGLQVEGENIVGGSFVVEMNTITVTDLEGEYATKLEGHLKSPDFFAVEEHPTAAFKITKVKPKTEGVFNSEITGNLTIKGITHSITFPAKVETKNGQVAAYGEMVVDRSKYDVRYGSESFFGSLGDKAIYDEFTLKVSLGAKG